jgi:hypothetical protein
MLLTKAVFLKILKGSPINLSFFCILNALLISRTTPVAAILNFAALLERV